MRRPNHRLYGHRLYGLMACIFAFLCITQMTSVAGEFGATFNSRLTCKYSSWHEGKVSNLTKDYITVDLVRDLLRHAPGKTVRIRNYASQSRGLLKGDSVLIYYHRKHPLWVRHSQCPASFQPGPHLMGKIDRIHNAIVPGGWCYQPSMLTWFYRSGRWDARVISEPNKRGGYTWLAQLPNGRKYLIYDEADPKRPAQYIVGSKPYKNIKPGPRLPWLLLTTAGTAVFLLLMVALRAWKRWQSIHLF
jgi:hypothetical protein